MFDRFRSNRTQLLVLAIGYLAIGLMMCFRPAFFLHIICYVMGALLIAAGVIGLLNAFKKSSLQVFFSIFHVILAAIGIFIITQPKAVSSILPLILGVILLADGLVNLSHGYTLKRFGFSGSLAAGILGFITLILGLIVLFHPYSTAKMTFRIIGAAFLYNGISDLIILFRMNRAATLYDRKHSKKQKIIDVETRPVTDGEDDEL